MRQLMKNDGIQERYGDEDKSNRIFKQQIEQAHELFPPTALYKSSFKTLTPRLKGWQKSEANLAV
jgi:hypothetical protein